MYSARGIQAYAEVSLQSQISGATPHQLITMLFDGAHNALLRAKICCEQGDVAERGKQLSKAINIIDNGLRSALDHSKGPQIAEQLDKLYDYFSRTLLRANLHNDPALIAHVDELLMNIASAWKEIE